MLKLTPQDSKALGLLVTPSWLSGLVVVLAGLIITAGVMVSFSVHNSPVQQQLIAWQQTQPKPSPSSFSERPLTEKPTLQNSWPLIGVWALIGLGVYFIAASIIRSLNSAVELKETLKYVNAKPEHMLQAALGHAVLRAVATIILIALFVSFLRHVIPYSITAAHAAAAEPASIGGVVYAFLSFAVVVLSLHVQVIFLRLAFGRVRLHGLN